MTTQPQTLTQLNAEEVFGKRPPGVPEFKQLNEIPRGVGETFLIYGGSGTGKTRLAGTCGDRTLFIDNGNGKSTLQDPGFLKAIGANPIIVSLNEKLGPRGVFDSATVYDAICDTIDYALEKFPERFDTIVVDDATQLRKGALFKGLEINQKTGKSQTQKNVVEKYDIVVPAVQDFGIEMNLIEQFIAGYTVICKEAGKNFIINAHERLTYRKGDKLGDAPVLAKTSPGFTGQTFPDAVPAYFDNVWYTQVVGSGSNRVWRIMTQGHESLTAKTRMGSLFPSVMDNVNMLTVFEKLKTGSPITRK